MRQYLRIYRQDRCWTERIIDTTHLRAAAGACALSIGLLVCSSSGAIALADETGTDSAPAETNDSSSPGDDTNDPSSTGPTSVIGNQRADEGEEDTTTNTAGTATPGVVTKVTSNGPTSVVSAQTNTSKDLTTAVDDLKDVVSTAIASATSAAGTAVSQVISVPEVTQTDTPTTNQSTAPEPTNVPAAGQGNDTSGSSSTPGGGSTPTGSSTAPKPKTFEGAVVTPFSNALNTIVRALGTSATTLAGLPGSQTPIADVITAIQIMITAVVDAVAEVAKVPGNLLDLLGFSAVDGPRPPVFGAAGAVDGAPPVPVDAPLIGTEPMQLPHVDADAPLFGNVVQASDLGGVTNVSMTHKVALSGLEPAPATVSAGTTSFLDHVVKSVLAPASLTALAAIAVPGIGGLLIVCAAGIRMGYRQAKASLALRVSGIARFAGPGPMGVVRSGSLIALYPRGKRVDKPRPAHAVRASTERSAAVLEQVA